MPTEREAITAKLIAAKCREDIEAAVAGALLAQRHELLAPFEEIADDFRAYGDERVAKLLMDVIATLRGHE